MFIRMVPRKRASELLLMRPIELADTPTDRAFESLFSVGPQTLGAIWGRDPSMFPCFPDVLVTVDGAEKDWIAWFAAFAPSLRPVSAYCRIMGITNFFDHLDAFRTPSLGGIEGACVGLILGEILSSEEVLLRQSEQLTASACASTLSFVLMRELAIHRRSVRSAFDLPVQWVTARHLTRQRERTSEVSDVIAVAEVLAALQRGAFSPSVDSGLLIACTEMVRKGELLSSASIPELLPYLSDVSGTREQRVNTLERAIADSLITSLKSHRQAFVLGYIASRINPGTLNHAPLLMGALRRHPSVMLWYGVCAGLCSDNLILAEYSGLARRILRDLLSADELIAKPRADISSLELGVLSRGDQPFEFPVASVSQLSIELDPGIWTTVNSPSRSRVQRNIENQWISYELKATISRLKTICDRIDPEADYPKQQTLRVDQPSRRGKKS